ncbi:MAG TPA: ferrous iron transporter B, partial [Candidatus Limiplasma stercoravium]|nr:ferrous iron transporter B [Candidatus Limiplasma stercoravium]
YLSQGVLTAPQSLDALRDMLAQHGWTAWTAACMTLFSLFHWPCSTTLWTIRRETGSWKWTLVALALPTLAGAALCAALNAIRLLVG